LAEYARDLGLEISLLTNGTLIRDRAAQIACLFNQVVVSLDSWRTEEYENLRGRGTFESTIRGIRKLAQTGKTQVYVRPVITRQNVGSLPDFPRYAASVLVCKDFMLALCMPTSIQQPAQLKLLPDPEEYRLALDGFHLALEEVGGTSNFETEPFLSDGNCGAGTNILSITSNGDVFPCQCLLHPDVRAGNIKDTPLDELRRASLFLLNLRQKRRTEFSACSKCPVSSLCTFKCSAVFSIFEDAEEAFINLLCPLSRTEIEYRLWNKAEQLYSEKLEGLAITMET
jgi:radical SAM protein with 4Fe4S-binding SPASM domain